MDRKTDRWAGGKVMWTSRYAIKSGLWVDGWREGQTDRQMEETEIER